MLAVPLGSAIFISPSAGLTSLMVALLAFLFNQFVIIREDTIAVIVMHQKLRKTLKMKEVNTW